LRHTNRQRQRRKAPQSGAFTWCRLFLISSLFAFSNEVFAQQVDKPEDAQKRLEAIENQIEATEEEKARFEEQAKEAEEAVETITRNMIALAAEIQQTEENASRLEQRIANLEEEERDKSASLEVRRGELSELLAALERLRRRPAALALLQPGEAVETAQSASLMSTLVPEINKQAASLKNELTALTIIQHDLAAERTRLNTSLDNLEEDRNDLAVLVENRRQEAEAANRGIEAEAQRLRKLAEEAESLQEFLAELSKRNARLRALAPPASKPTRPGTTAPSRAAGTLGRNFAAAKGNIPYPARGPIVIRFGQRDGFIDSKGIRIDGRTGGQVISTFDGQIVFSGPFRNYGNLLIIEHRDGYHTLLAGMDQVYSGLGQSVLTGEPIGVLNDGANSRSELYLELRERGSAVDPIPWLRRDGGAR